MRRNPITDPLTVSYQEKEHPPLKPPQRCQATSSPFRSEYFTAAKVQTQASMSFMTQKPFSAPRIKSAPKTDSLRMRSPPQRNNTNFDTLNSSRPTLYA